MPTPVAKTKGAPAKARTQAELIAYLAGRSGLDKKQVRALLAGLAAAAIADLNRKDIGKFTVPGIVTLRVVRKPATGPREGFKPFSKIPTTFAAKPARNVIKSRYPKKLRDSIV